jgi:streptogramin lyase
MIYDHVIHQHELYVGCNHGVTRFRPDQFRYPRPGEWFATANLEWMGDHVHPYVCYHRTCDSAPGGHMIGGWRGLALAPDGHLWVAGRWTAGKIRWDPSLARWIQRNGEETFMVSFGDPYFLPTPPDAPGHFNEPVFRPPQQGDPVNLSAVSVAPDGRVWFTSDPTFPGPLEIPYGVAVWDNRQFRVFDPVRDIGMSEPRVRDLIALPDGRILLAASNTGLLLWNPSTGARQALRAPAWLADDRVQRMELDMMVSPPALHVSTETGATVIRRLP